MYVIILKWSFQTNLSKSLLKVARLNFLGGYLPHLSINYVGMSKDMGKRLPQPYYIMMKISYDMGFIAIRVAMTNDAITLFIYLCVSLYQEFFEEIA